MEKPSHYTGNSATRQNGVVTAKAQEVPHTSETANAVAQPEKTLPDSAPDLVKEKLAEHTLPPAGNSNRTFGLKAFDVFLYPILTNFSVFAISVAATYLTSRGGDRNAEGKLIYGKVGEFFQKRGDWLMNKFKSLGMNHSQADMSKMVFFSFLDGSMMAPAVKLLEDRREKIGRCIDDACGTTPEDTSVYKAEPKQTWLSVLGGRLATVAIVVPTAVALDKTGLNDALFTKPGARMGEALAKKPGIAKWFGKLDVKELSKISLFEFFYTSVCTTGLYFSSRFFARKQEQHEGHEPQKAAPVAPTTLASVAAPADGHKATPAFASKHAKAASFTERYETETASPTLAI